MLEQIRSWINEAKKVFEPKALSDIIYDEVYKATTEKLQAERVIRNHEFIKHMAEAKIAALDEWNKR